jgi:hypothetical protein
LTLALWRTYDAGRIFLNQEKHLRAPLTTSRRSARALVGVLAATLALAVPGCDKPSHENVDSWMATEKGPQKLQATVKSSDADPELRAHAAHNLILMERYGEVKEMLDAMPESERGAVMTKLAPRLWDSAKFQTNQDELAMPSPEQNMAKDALFELRGMAGPETRTAIDGWLVEWLTGGYYEGRAKEGRIPGRMVIRAVGRPAAPKLLAAARSMIARPANADGTRVKIGDELLAGLALTGDPETMGFVLDLAVGEFKDETLGARATTALWEAFVEPPTGLEPLDARAALLTHLPKLLTMVRNESLPGAMVNDAADLIAAIGPPECLQPFVDMVAYPHGVENFRWMGAQKALRCAGADAIRPVVESIRIDIAYDRGRLEKYVWKEVLAVNAKGKVADEARALLDSKSWVGRVTGIELLGALAVKERAAEDAKRIRALAGDPKVLTGWWGKAGAAEKKPDPTLGKVAAEVAARLEALAKGSESK